MPLAVVAALPVLLLTWSRRKAINFSIGLWADMSSAVIGMKVDINGEEHLQSPRPAVFILNHQCNADGFLVAKLIRRDIAFMGKAELARQPVRSRLMQMGGLILVDRQNAARAGAAMQAMVSAIRTRGLSAAIFPEGRRSHSLKLGQFKKGAFLIAIRARAPIIPIVIHNSIDAQPKGEKFYRPANVRVEVLPAIDVSQWKIKSIDQHMSEVRDLYLEVLGQANHAEKKRDEQE
jgi:putative phosphoserine phosphatase/1-acylglycerol-3-phosphate O-acyltransferase